jgi:hypothetical protein
MKGEIESKYEIPHVLKEDDFEAMLGQPQDLTIYNDMYKPISIKIDDKKIIIKKEIVVNNVINKPSINENFVENIPKIKMKSNIPKKPKFMVQME